MFDICEITFKDLDLPINLDNCLWMRICPRFDKLCSSITINKIEIHRSNKLCYLGINIVSAKEFTCDWHDSKGKYFTATNTILGRLGTHNDILFTLNLI